MIFVLMGNQPSLQLKHMVFDALQDIPYTLVEDVLELPDLKNKKILFAAEINATGINASILQMFESLEKRGRDALLGSTGALILHSSTELFTKSFGSHILFLANQLGCSFMGHPLVEATQSLKNFKTWQKTLDLSLEEIAVELSRRLVLRLIDFEFKKVENPRIAYLHSSSRATSNTLMLWQMVEENLQGFNIHELYIENGSVFDCFGCSYKTCLALGRRGNCYYGDVITEKVTPIIEDAHVLVWICPNYNDLIPSNLVSVINRLTALYRQISFHEKTFFAMIVSGNSGSDSLAKQLIDALNINKGFYLPPYFCLMEIANDAGSILQVEDIHKKADNFAENIKLQSSLKINKIH